MPKTNPSAQDFSNQDLKSYRERIEKHAHESCADSEALLDQLEELMGNFAHRYLVTSEDSNVSPKRQGNLIEAYALEKNMKEALKYAHPSAREGIVKLLQTVPLKEGPTVKYTLQFECLEWDREGAGKIRAMAAISWDHPNHSDSEKVFKIEKIFKSEDALDYRNRFPRFVEQDICRVFSNE